MTRPDTPSLERIAELFDSGHTYRQIAEAVGGTPSRMAHYVARARRQGLVKRPVDATKQHRAKRPRGAAVEARVPMLSFLGMPPVVVPPVRRDGPQPLLTAPLATCRAVVGEDERGALYCCAPKVKRSVHWYCAEHARGLGIHFAREKDAETA